MQQRNTKTDRRLQRRSLTEDEVRSAIHAAEHGTIACGLSGFDRAVLYRLACGSGFRAGELAFLTPESFDLDATPPTVTVTAGYSKRKREDAQPIRADLADRLGPWLAGKVAGKPVFDVLRLAEKTAKALRVDLEATGIPYTDSAGRVADFHT